MFIRKSKFNELLKDLEDSKRLVTSLKKEVSSLKTINEKLEKLYDETSNELSRIRSECNCYDDCECCFDEACNCENVELCYTVDSIGPIKYKEIFKNAKEDDCTNYTLNLIGRDSEIYLQAIFDIIYMLDTRTNKKVSIKKQIIDKFVSNDVKEYINSEEFTYRMEHTPEKDFKVEE